MRERERITDFLIENLERYMRGQDLLGLVDAKLGY